MNLTRRLVQQNVLIYKLAIKLHGLFKNIKVIFSDTEILIKKNSKEIILGVGQINFARGIVDHFDFYFSSVLPTYIHNENRESVDPIRVVDFSISRAHEVPSFILNNFTFPTIAEPLQTAITYSRILDLGPGDTIIDLGSYSGLTSIYFKEVVAAKAGGGVVLAVEPDYKNFQALEINAKNYKEKTGKEILMIQAAVYDRDGYIDFVSEGTLDSAVVGSAPNLYVRESNLVKVRCFTLSTLVNLFNLTKVDCIKADIEGSEIQALSDAEFFSKHRPRIVLEPISLKGRNGLQEISKVLEKWGYRGQEYSQPGGNVPLVLFSNESS